MATTLLDGPTVEPITLAEAKAHLRVDTNAEDTLIQSLVTASRLHIEAALDLALITQAWRAFRDTWPKSRTLDLPLRPVQNLTAVRIRLADDTVQELDTDAFILDGTAIPARLVWRGTGTAPASARAASGIEIDFIAGYGDAPSDVPQPIRHALLLLTAHWYENREPAEIGAASPALPAAISELLSPYRWRRI